MSAIRKINSLALNEIKKLFSTIKSRRKFYLYKKNKVKNKESIYPNVDEVLSAPYIFVLSTGRCGTALLTKILKASKTLDVHHNPYPNLGLSSSMIHKNNYDNDTLKFTIMTTRFEGPWLNAYINDQTYVETNNRITFYAEALAELLPNSKFIQLTRHPVSFIRSGIRRNYYKSNHNQYQRLQKITEENKKNSQIYKVAREWLEINTYIEEFKTKISSSRILSVRSEDLFHTTSITDKIFNFIETENPFQIGKNLKNLEKLLRTPVNKQLNGKFPKYAEWTNEQKDDILYLKPLASLYNYKT